MKLSPTKLVYTYRASEVPFFGHLFTNEGTEPDPDKFVHRTKPHDRQFKFEETPEIISQNLNVKEPNKEARQTNPEPSDINTPTVVYDQVSNEHTAIHTSNSSSPYVTSSGRVVKP
ncbi:hypothetical protein GQR58_007231 [Nymphon striatum]|nr:hypothetical protein GQR58_007231 [Nymphon striatum]